MRKYSLSTQLEAKYVPRLGQYAHSNPRGEAHFFCQEKQQRHHVLAYNCGLVVGHMLFEAVTA